MLLGELLLTEASDVESLADDAVDGSDPPAVVLESANAVVDVVEGTDTGGEEDLDAGDGDDEPGGEVVPASAAANPASRTLRMKPVENVEQLSFNEEVESRDFRYERSGSSSSVRDSVRSC